MRTIAPILLALALAVLAAGPVRATFDVKELDRYIFVAGEESPEIAVVDSQRDAVVDRLTLPQVPDQFLVSDIMDLLVASHRDDNSLSLIDLSGEKDPRRIELPLRPEQIQLAPLGERLAVISTSENRIALVSLTDGQVLWLNDQVAAPNHGIFDRGGGRLYVSSESDGRIAVLSFRDGSMIRLIELAPEDGALPRGISYLTQTPGKLYGFALHKGEGRLSVIDLREESFIQHVALPGPAQRAYPTANGQYILVTSPDSESLSMISTWTYDESLRFDGGEDLSGVNTGLFDAVGVAFRRDDNKAVFLDLIDGGSHGEIPLPGRPETAITADVGRKVYLALKDRDSLAVIDLAEGRITKIIEGMPAAPWAVLSTGGLSYCH